MKRAAPLVRVAAVVTLGCSLLGCSLLGCSLLGCSLQQFNADAASATVLTPAISPDQHTVALDTPTIQVTPGDNGMSTDDACEATRFQAMDILRINCAGCHGGGPGQNLGQPAFDYVLDVERLLMAVSETVKDPRTMKPVRFLIPGDPDHSRVYARVFHGEMPPMSVVGLPDNLSRPTVSDVSVIRHWIAYCLGATPPPVGDGGTATDAGTTASDGGAASDLRSDSDDRGQTLARSASQ